jgi:hypothetical protein
MEEVQKPTNSMCYTPSSEPFRIYLTTEVSAKPVRRGRRWFHETNKHNFSRKRLCSVLCARDSLSRETCGKKSVRIHARASQLLYWMFGPFLLWAPLSRREISSTQQTLLCAPLKDRKKGAGLFNNKRTASTCHSSYSSVYQAFHAF